MTTKYYTNCFAASKPFQHPPSAVSLCEVLVQPPSCSLFPYFIRTRNRETWLLANLLSNFFTYSSNYTHHHPFRLPFQTEQVPLLPTALVNLHPGRAIVL